MKERQQKSGAGIAARAPKSASLLAEDDKFRRQPFTETFLIFFPPDQRSALIKISDLLYYCEDMYGECCPEYRGSHNLAIVRAVMQDLIFCAQSLAQVAADLEYPASCLAVDLRASRIADDFAIKVRKLADKLALKIGVRLRKRQVGPPKSSGKKQRQEAGGD